MDRSITSFGDAQLRALGARIRALRESRSLSLKRLAKEADVSGATLQAIEAGASSPGLLTIVAIAEALGEPVDRLIAASLAASTAVRFVHGKVARRTKGVQDLTGVLTSPSMRSWVYEIAPGEKLSRTDRPALAPLFVLILDGRIEFGFADGSFEALRKGDSIHMTQDAPSAWTSIGATPARALCIADTRAPDKGTG